MTDRMIGSRGQGPEKCPTCAGELSWFTKEGGTTFWCPTCSVTPEIRAAMSKTLADIKANLTPKHREEIDAAIQRERERRRRTLH